MGIEYYVQGRVTLDEGAATALRALTLWGWLSDEHPHSGPLEITFHPTWYRNIQPHLRADLTRAQQHGNVTGELHVHCSDSNHYWEALSYRQREVWNGSTACYHEPVTLRRSVLVNLSDILPEHMRKIAEGWVELTPDRSSDSFELVGENTPLTCGCAGWDHNLDRPLCSTRQMRQVRKLRRTKS